MQSINPATNSLIKTYEPLTEPELEARLALAQRAFGDWKRQPFDVRATMMRKAAALLRERSRALAELMTAEMGKPIAGGLGEVNKCAWVCEYYAEEAEGFLRDEGIDTDARRSFVASRPLGPVLAVMPWNFPFWQVFRFAAPALMAGNVGLLKHASNVPGCALAIEAIFLDAGFPPGVFTTLLVGSDRVEGLIADRRVVAVTLTGSTPAGKAVAAAAGAALKKSVLELGGSDPYVLLADADLEQAVPLCVFARLLNSGQSCIAAKRFIVVESIREEFEARFVAAMAAAVWGDPMNEDTFVGPMARTELRDELHQQVVQSVERGATLLLGGQIPAQVGAYYPPTVLTDVRPGMPAYDEELFGPVAAIITVADEAEAMRVANDTIFGLGAALFTRDVERGQRLAVEHLDAGCCFVNDFVHSDPRLPFGGIKDSGYGRELSHHGIEEFVNRKTVYVK